MKEPDVDTRWVDNTESRSTVAAVQDGEPDVGPAGGPGQHLQQAGQTGAAPTGIIHTLHFKIRLTLLQQKLELLDLKFMISFSNCKINLCGVSLPPSAEPGSLSGFY